MRRIGIDVGGTNTDAVLIEEGKVVRAVKAPTSEDVTTGILDSLQSLGSTGVLKEADGKDIWLFGGGELFRSLLDLGLVDTIEIGVIPVLLGGGIPLLPPGGRAGLTLVTHRAYEATGTISLQYAVKKPGHAVRTPGSQGARKPARRKV